MYIVFILQCQKKSENLSDLNKKDRNKRHSSPFINVVKGVFFVVRVTLVPVSYLSAPSAVHSYRVPGKFIRRLKFIRLLWIKQKFIRIAYLYSKCTDCRINFDTDPKFIITVFALTFFTYGTCLKAKFRKKNYVYLLKFFHNIHLSRRLSCKNVNMMTFFGIWYLAK